MTQEDKPQDNLQDNIDIKRLLTLSKLSLSEQEERDLLQHLGSMQNFIQDLFSQDIPAETAPLFHPTEVAYQLRADAVTEIPDRELLQQNAPETSSGFFLVNKVIE